MSETVAKRRWLELKKCYEELANEERSLMIRLGDNRKKTYKIVMDMHRLAILITKSGESFTTPATEARDDE